MTNSQARWQLVDELSLELIETYDAAEDYSEDKLYEGLCEAREDNVSEIARKVFEGAVAMVIDELLTTDVGLEVLQRINAYRIKRLIFLAKPDELRQLADDMEAQQQQAGDSVICKQLPVKQHWSRDYTETILEIGYAQ